MATQTQFPERPQLDLTRFQPPQLQANTPRQTPQPALPAAAPAAPAGVTGPLPELSEESLRGLTPEMSNFLARLGIGDAFGRGFQTNQQQAGSSAALNLYGFGGQAFPLGLTNLIQILSGRGATDPVVLQREQTEIGRNTEDNKQAVLARLAQTPGGLESGVGQALLAGIDLSGSQRQGEARSREAQIQESRQREDLMNLLLPLLQIALNTGQQGVQNKQADSSKRTALTSSLINAAAVAAAPFTGGATLAIPAATTAAKQDE